MHAVVARSKVHDLERGRGFLQEQGIPRLKQSPGFVGGYWVALDDGVGTSIVVFETEEQARSAAEQLKANPPPAEAVTVSDIQVGRVVANV